MKVETIHLLIRSINKSIEDNNLIAALIQAVTIPDICGNVLYPNIKSTGYRYKKWFDEYIGQYEKYEGSDEDMPYMSGELCYAIRNSLLHEGNNKDANKKLDDFQFILSDLLGCSSVTRHNINSKKSSIERKMKINVKEFCLKMIWCVEGFLKDIEDKNLETPKIDVFDKTSDIY